MEATADAVDSGLLRFSAGSVIGTGGMVDTPNQRLSVRNVLPIVTPADLAEVPVDAPCAPAPRRIRPRAPGPAAAAAPPAPPHRSSSVTSPTWWRPTSR